MIFRYFILFFFLVHFHSFHLFAQTIEILPLPYPENRLSYPDVWNFQAINTGKNTVVGIKIEIEERQSGKMAQITTPDFLLLPGTTVFNSASESASMSKAIYFNKKFENSFVLPAGAPSGNYKICIYFTIKNGLEILASKCVEQEVIQCPQPILIYPSDEAILSERNPLFNWTSLNQITVDDKVSFSIHIKEILVNQSKEEAMRSNLEVFSEKNISNNMQLYPPSAKPLENGIDYCWQVRVYVSNELCAQSEVWKFEFEEPQYKKDKPKKDAKSYATLLRELDAGYYPVEDDTLRFRYEDIYNKGIVNYKIYNNQNQLLTGTLPALNRRPLDNLFDLNLSVLPEGFYVLEVITEKNERLALRFKKSQ